MIKKLLFAAAAMVALTGTAHAATDGTLGHTSTGSFHIGVRLPLLVDITGLTDIKHTFTAAEIAAAAAGPSYTPVILSEHDFCVYSNNGVDGSYAIKVTGPAGPAGGNENFGLTGSGGSIPMRVWFTDVPGNIYADSGLYPSTLPNGAKVTGFKADNDGNHRPYTLNCSDVGNADAGVAVQFPVGALLAATAGHYHGHITITVSPT
jgi:hypothetical protein